MSLPLIMIATASVAFTLGGLTMWPFIRRLRNHLTDAIWQLEHDPVTGMLNRAGLIAAHATLAEADNAGPIIVALIDLDDFKPVNDTHGHDRGDEILVAVGDRIRDIAALHGGTAGRLAGDEYAALLPVRTHDLARIADTFVALISQPVELTADGKPITVTVTASVGLALAEATDPFEEVALRRADIAMYHAKHHGRNRHAVYEPGMAMPTADSRRGPRLRDRQLNDEAMA
ncbi:GGDEF domain-containing protein [Micromonospora sp. DR5-3]|uniref:GGDEF domain-containing protein n=1 Tax=unclassified Micromonospora TaxID=2617518 RepID=UPI0011D673D4|nr:MULTISPECIES: GGDEF domain-containing protein [unclassified Micromonospora]MCW3819531.1 GGDEF domain-containing protein [Micromonospora sp. DR5-3]TYC12159.1 GGDEF domain-containing protein [Micromonospora sp. MP36]